MPVAMSLLPLGPIFQQQLHSSSAATSNRTNTGMVAILQQHAGGGERIKQGWLRPPDNGGAGGQGGATSSGGSSTPQPQHTASLSGWAIVEKARGTESSRTINWWHDRVKVLETPIHIRGRQPFEVRVL